MLEKRQIAYLKKEESYDGRLLEITESRAKTKNDPDVNG
jgi:hypothetical protein